MTFSSIDKIFRWKAFRSVQECSSLGTKKAALWRRNFAIARARGAARVTRIYLFFLDPLHEIPFRRFWRVGTGSCDGFRKGVKTSLRPRRWILQSPEALVAFSLRPRKVNRKATKHRRPMLGRTRRAPDGTRWKRKRPETSKGGLVLFSMHERCDSTRLRVPFIRFRFNNFTYRDSLSLSRYSRAGVDGVALSFISL